MQLKDFVSTVLTELVNGICSAQDECLRNGGIVNPPNLVATNKNSASLFDQHSGRLVQVIDFEVALTTKESSGKKAGVGVFVTVFGLGAQGTSKESTSEVGRVRFSIPIMFPICEIKCKDANQE